MLLKIPADKEAAKDISVKSTKVTFDGYFLFFIFVIKLLDDRRLTISPAIILVRPPIIVLALVNKNGQDQAYAQ